MKSTTASRRQIMKQMAMGAAATALSSRLFAAVPSKSKLLQYDPNANFDLNVAELEYKRNKSGRPLIARVYQPIGPGPFPTVLDLHGGAWNFKDRFAEEPMDRSIAMSGVLVVAIDMTLAPEAPYPACIQDANYAVRWLKSRAAQWNGNASKIGVYGSSSGGYVALQLAMRPRDPRYSAIPFPEAPRTDATIAYAMARAPISNTAARFENAEGLNRDTMIDYNKRFFDPWETIHESNPQEMLDRHEKVALPPLLILQGALDDNVPPAVQAKFAKTYNAAGGHCDFYLFEDSVHQWTAKEGPHTDRARRLVREFIKKQVATDG